MDGPDTPLPCLVYAAFAPTQGARRHIHTLPLGAPPQQDAGQVGALNRPLYRPTLLMLCHLIVYQSQNCTYGKNLVQH